MIIENHIQQSLHYLISMTPWPDPGHKDNSMSNFSWVPLYYSGQIQVLCYILVVSHLSWYVENPQICCDIVIIIAVLYVLWVKPFVPICGTCSFDSTIRCDIVITIAHVWWPTLVYSKCYRINQNYDTRSFFVLMYQKLCFSTPYFVKNDPFCPVFLAFFALFPAHLA